MRYHVEEPIEILFDQLDMGLEFAIAGNSPFSDHQLADMGIAQILATWEYTHAYRMWKIIVTNERTCVCFKANLQEENLDMEILDQTAGEAGYGSANNVKHVETKDSFMDFGLAMASCDAVFTKLTTKNGNLTTQLRQQ